MLNVCAWVCSFVCSHRDDLFVLVIVFCLSFFFLWSLLQITCKSTVFFKSIYWLVSFIQLLDVVKQTHNNGWGRGRAGHFLNTSEFRNGPQIFWFVTKLGGKQKPTDEMLTNNWRERIRKYFDKEQMNKIEKIYDIKVPNEWNGYSLVNGHTPPVYPMKSCRLKNYHWFETKLISLQCYAIQSVFLYIYVCVSHLLVFIWQISLLYFSDLFYVLTLPPKKKNAKRKNVHGTIHTISTQNHKYDNNRNIQMRKVIHFFSVSFFFVRYWKVRTI